MALQVAYKQFLAAPNSAALAGNASLHYITSTTSYNGAADIIKHLNTLRNQVKKKKEDFLNVVEGGNGIAAEVDTSLEFITSGAAYLPALDDNFLSDRTVYLPIVHIVSFDAEGKITQIRQSWDQGSLLKQLDIIGKTGRNWPIRDSAEQIRLITNSIKASAAATTAATGEGGADLPVRSRGNSNITRDPHASLSLFGAREEMGSIPQSVVSPYAGGSRPKQRDFAEIFGDEPVDENATPRAGVVSPYAGTRPRQRDFAEIFGDQPEDVPSPSSGRDRGESQSKAIAPKIGAGKNYQASRLFETEEGVETDPNTPEKGKPENKSYRPHPTKFKHFDFADGSEPQDAPQRGFTTEQAPKTKHGSHWSFDDFTTPAKPGAASKATRAHDVRHWGTENDEVLETPARKPAPPKPRKDAEPHFEFRDDGVPSGDSRATRPRGASHNTNMGLYENNLYNEDGSVPTAGPGDRALGNITNIKDRSKIFDPHFEYTDDPTHGSGASKPSASEDRMKVVKMMESNWGAYDESPAQKENNPITGAGGSRNGSSGPEGQRIQIMGDGMGGKKAGGSGRGWAIGDESDEERNTKAVPGKKPGAGQKAGGNFWDF